MKYYYDDVLAAGWMAKHFGMLFLDNESSGGDREYKVDYRLMVEGNDFKHPMKRYYVHDDSLDLLVPQLGDVVLSTDNMPAYVVDGFNMTGHELGMNYQCRLTEAKRYVGTEGIIIRRGDVEFFWPKQED